MLTERFAAAGRPTRLVVALGVLLTVIVAFAIVSSPVLGATESTTTPVRIFVAVALLAPLSLMMGMPFAIGMRMATHRPGATTAFMWGINGATSVCGSVFGLVIALFFGIAAAFWVGALVYLLALIAMMRIVASDPEPFDVSEPSAALGRDRVSAVAADS